MPIIPNTATALLNVSLMSMGIKGSASAQLAQGIALGLIQSLPSFTVTTAATGVSGIGVGTGKVLLNPVLGLPVFLSAFAAQDLRGVLTPALAQGIVSGVASFVNTQAAVTTQVALVASGTGVGVTLVIPTPSLTTSLQAQLNAAGILGVKSSALAQALGTAFTAWLPTALINTVIVGVPTIPAVSAIGPGIGVIT